MNTVHGFRLVACSLLFFPFLALGQVTAKAPAFEAATVRPNAPDSNFFPPIRSSDAVQLRYRNYPLKALLAEANGMAEFQIKGPAWIANERYDINAVKPKRTTEDDARQMLRSLLAERFHLVAHSEVKQMPGYVLLPGKNQSKLRPEKDAPTIPGCNSFGTLAEFAKILAHNLDAPVADKTGIGGTWYFILAYSNSLATTPLQATGVVAPPPLPITPHPPPCPGWSFASMPPLAASIFEAVKDQMGLKLENVPASPVTVLVIDRADKIPQNN
jgi:uncharacterized protein (TIGR03435 family)